MLAAVEALADRLPIPIEALEILPERLRPEVESSVYFLISEALTKVIKHAEATRASVHVQTESGLLVVEVSDDGVGAPSR